MRTPHRKIMVSRNGTSPKHTGRNLAPPAIKRWLLSLHLTELRLLPLRNTSVREAALEAIPQSKKSHKMLFHGGISSETLQQNETDLAFKWLLFSNGADLGLEGLYQRQGRPLANSFAHRSHPTHLKSLEGNKKLLRSPLQLFHPNVACPRYFSQK